MIERRSAKRAVDDAVVRYLTESEDGYPGAAAIELVDLLLAIADESVVDMEVVDGRIMDGGLPIDEFSAEMLSRTTLGMVLGRKYRVLRGSTA